MKPSGNGLPKGYLGSHGIRVIVAVYFGFPGSFTRIQEPGHALPNNPASVESNSSPFQRTTSFYCNKIHKVSFDVKVSYLDSPGYEKGRVA